MKIVCLKGKSLSKIIGLSQNINLNKYDEYQNCLNINWFRFILKLGFVPLQIPQGSKGVTEKLFNQLKIDGIILTGGNDVYYNEKNPKQSRLSKLRNKSEELIIKKCLINNIPIIGVCRGMQFINTYFGGKLKLIKNHAGSHKHKIYNKSKYNFPIKVNTFHNYGIPFRYNSKFTKILAVDDEKNVEAFIHLKKKILGIMWHPEREKRFKKQDLDLFRSFFCD